MGAIEEKINLKPLDKILESATKGNMAELIPILQEIQKVYGYLPETVLAELSRRMRFPMSRIYGVATFYEQFYLEPRGRYIVRCCRGTACHVRGGRDLIKSVGKILGLQEGQTTEDMEFTFETVSCLGACALSPVMVINGIYYGKMTSRKVKTILDGYKQAEKEKEPG